MKIKSLRASFGKLNNAALSLGDGLNIIEAPNEAGKSTWCAFLKNLLFGLNTGARGKAGHLPDKVRYQPWSGAAMEGAAELSVAGRDITIQRTGTGSAPMRRFSAVYTGTGEPVDWLTGSSAGEALTGMSEKVFERTAFIRQAGVRVDQDAELEKRIASLVSTGDEQTSFTEADKLLRDWRNKLRTKNRTGSLPRLERELAEAEAALDSLDALEKTVAAERSRAEELSNRKQALETQLNLLDQFEAYDAAQRVERVRSEVDRFSRETAELRDQLTVNGHLLSREDVASLQAALQTQAELEPVLENLENAEQTAAREVRTAEERRSASPFSPMTDSQVSEVLRQAEIQETAIAQQGQKRRQSSYGLRLGFAGAAVVLAAAAVCVFFGLFATIPVGIVFAALAAGCLFLVLLRPRHLSHAVPAGRLLTLYHVGSFAALRDMAGSYRSLLQEEASARAVHRAAEQNLQQAQQTAAAARRRLAEAALCFPYRSEDLSAAALRRSADETAALLDRLAAVEQQRISAQSALDTLEAGGKAGVHGPVPPPDQPRPTADRAALAAALDQTRRQFEAVSESYNLALGRARMVGDPVVLSGRIRSLREQIAAQERTYEALTLAGDTLAEANAELRTRFSPLISRRAAEILSRLTGGAYEALAVDKDFGASVQAAADPVSRDALSLSAGTVDQLYLALRLAMCDLLPESEPAGACPLVLDDALANFDDARACAALRFLREMARTRQILLFTCHSRERLFFADDPAVTIVQL